MKCVKIVLAGLVALVATVYAWPPPDEVVKTKPIVDELMSAKGTLAPADEAEAANAFADEAKGEAAKYLLLRRAIALYAKAGDDGKTADAFQKLVKDVKDVPPAVQERILLEAGRTLAKRVRPLKTEAVFKGVRALVWADKELAAARMELTGSKKNDPAANLRAGNALAVLGDWPKALEHLRGAQGKIAPVAEHEIKGTATADNLANAWWKASAATESDYVKNAYRRHSVELYRKALEENLLEGLGKTLARNRISEFEKESELSAGPAAGDTSGAARPVAATARTSSKPVIVAQNPMPTDKKYKFNYRLDDKGNATLIGHPCISPKPEGVLVVPDKIDGHMVTKIDNCAFADCDKMTRVILPSHLEEIVHMSGGMRNPGYIFWGCFALEAIEIARSNTRYTSEKGALYTKDKKCLIAYPKTRSEITLARETTVVGLSAFISCTFKTVRIPEPVESIGFWAFSDCRNLEVVEFPKYVKWIGAYVFDKSWNMKKVVFYGDAPAIGVRRTRARPNLFWGSPDGIVVEVRKGTRGWNGKGSTELPELWPLDGNPKRRIRYIP